MCSPSNSGDVKVCPIEMFSIQLLDAYCLMEQRGVPQTAVGYLCTYGCSHEDHRGRQSKILPIGRATRCSQPYQSPCTFPQSSTALSCNLLSRQSSPIPVSPPIYLATSVLSSYPNIRPLYPASIYRKG